MDIYSDHDKNDRLEVSRRWKGRGMFYRWISSSYFELFNVEDGKECPCLQCESERDNGLLDEWIQVA